MERKAKVTQEIVNAACMELLQAGKNITVNAVINACGGSFSTVGQMVKNWKEEQVTQSTPVIEMPEAVTKAMQKATADIWSAAAALASETIERIQKEAGEAITKAKNELSEYAGEVSRLEGELESQEKELTTSTEKLIASTAKISELATKNAALETRLSDRDIELERLRSDYEKLQAELIVIAKEQIKKKNEDTKK